MRDHEAILAAIREDPRDRLSWAAYADWLEEAGRPLEAYAIRSGGLAGVRVSKFSEGARLSRMEIFATGRHRDRDYTAADLAGIVLNFRKFSSPRAEEVLLRVPCVIGHEEDQAYLQRTDLPAAG